MMAPAASLPSPIRSGEPRSIYNAQGTLVTFTDPGGGVTSYAYDANNNMIQMTDPRSIVQMQNTLDSIYRVVKQVLPDGGILSFVYAAVNPLVATSPLATTQITDSNGVQATIGSAQQVSLLA